MVESKPERCIVLQRAALEAELDPARDLDWQDALAGAEPADCVTARGHRPALHPLHVGDDRAAEGDRPRQRRPRCRARVVDEEHLRRRARARCTGPPRTSAGRSATRTSSTGRCCTAARPSSTRASRSARPTRARSGASRPSTASARSSPRRPRSARSASRIPTASTSAATTSRGFRTLFLAGERCDPETLGWAEEKLGDPRDRPLVADRDGLADRRQLPRDRAAAGRPRLADAGRARLGRARAWTRRGAERPPGEIGALVVKLPLPPGSSPTLWNADERYRETYLDDLPGLLPDRRRGLRRRGRLRLRHGPHRRHHQRRRPPPLDRRDGGGARRAPGRRGVRGDRRRRRAQGPAAARLRRPQGGRRRGRTTRSPPRSCSSCATASARSPRSRRRSSSTRLPKTRSGKILRGTMRRIADGEAYTTPADDRRPRHPRRDRGGAARRVTATAATAPRQPPRGDSGGRESL